jgi:hypothetical protein
MSESGNREKLEWVRGLKRLEKRPLFQILDVVDEARSVARETFWIAFCAVNGFPLFNKSLPIAVKTYVWPRKRVRGWIPSD